jgi:cation transport protein ChaC
MSLTRVDLESSQIQQAIAFVINPQHRAYAGHLAPDIMVEHIATARGTLGSCAEYLAQTVEGLAQAGIKDKALLQLQQQVLARQQQAEGDRNHRAGTP